MAFGNMGDDCGTGVAFTRDPATGNNGLFGEFLTNAQGEDVVAGVRSVNVGKRKESIFQQVMRLGTYRGSGTGREITGGKSEAAGAYQCPGTISGSGSGGCDPCSDGDCTSR